MRINENINWGIINLVQYQILQSNLNCVTDSKEKY